MAQYDDLIKLARKNYLDSTWKKILEYLNFADLKKEVKKWDSSQMLPKNIKKKIKEKLKGFNDAFGTTNIEQQQFSVPDSDLRSQLRQDNVELIVDKYKDLYETFVGGQVRFSFTTKIQRYVKYTPKALEDSLNHFFDEEA